MNCVGIFCHIFIAVVVAPLLLLSAKQQSQRYHHKRDRRYYNGSFFMLHIPKCAGTSFINDLKHIFPGYKIFGKETCYNFMLRFISHEKATLNITKLVVYNVTMLRSPLAHVYSQFLECKYDEWGQTQTAKTDFPRNSSDIIGFNMWLDRFHANWTTKDKDFNCYNPFNMQARAMTCIEGTNHRIGQTNHRLIIDPRYPQIELAIENAEKFTFIGIVEYYKLSLCALMYQMTGRISEICLCPASGNSPQLPAIVIASSPTASTKGTPPPGSGPQIKLYNITHKTPYHSTSDLSKETVAKVRRLTTIDQQLYDRYVARLLLQLRAIESDHGVKMLNCS